MPTHSIQQDLNYGFVILTTLVSIKLWSFTGVDDKIFDVLEVVVLIGLLLLVLLKHSNDQEMVFRNNVILFLSIPILSAFGALIFHEQSLQLSALVLRTNFLWLLYFVLHRLNVPVNRIINLMVFVGLVWIFLTVIQQFTYPTYYFSTRGDDGTSDLLRAGVYRFMLNRHHYGLFIVLYFFYHFLQKRRIRDLLFVLIGLIGFYYYGTRQFALAVIICMALTVFVVKGTIRIVAFGFVMALLLLLFAYSDVLFGDYIEMTSSQLSSEDEIRLISGHFFLNEYWPHWLAKVIGNGVPHYLSAYGQEMDYIKENLRLFRSDVGIIGAFNQFGILYVLNILWLNIKGLRNRYYSGDTKYLKFIFVNSLLLLLLSEYYADASAIPFFCFVLYLVDKSFDDKKEEEEQEQELEHEQEEAYEEAQEIV